MAQVKTEAPAKQYAVINTADRRSLRQERAELRKLADWQTALHVDQRESDTHDEPLHDSRAMRNWYLRYNSIPTGVKV